MGRGKPTSKIVENRVISLLKEHKDWTYLDIAIKVDSEKIKIGFEVQTVHPRVVGYIAERKGLMRQGKRGPNSVPGKKRISTVAKEAEESNKPSVVEKSWEEFRSTGLFWFVNSFLHAFGWSLVCEFEQGKQIRVYPARTTFRGFSEEVQTRNHQKIAEYLQENIEELVAETKS